MTNKRPVGALTWKEFAKADPNTIYMVHANGDSLLNKLKMREKEIVIGNVKSTYNMKRLWFEVNEIGAFFDNYFHAYAYLLKLKAADKC